MNKALTLYGFNDDCLIERFGNGLINHTCIVNKNGKKYIFQKVNDSVFKEPISIADNLELIGNYFSNYKPDYYFTRPVKAINGSTIVHVEREGYYRAFPFVTGSHTIDVVQNPQQAYEAAKQFGKFTKELSGIDINTIKVTLPNFHDLSLRYRQFCKSIDNGNKTRISETASLIDLLKSFSGIVDEYEAIKTNPEFKLRVTHHDTKISNVLFDDNEKGICVIDLDTVMPGYFISDVGDMMRTYLCPVSEEEKDISKIEVREDFYHAIVDGYSEFMKDELTEIEKRYFFYSGKFMIYMQALRFLTDYLNDDVYYGARYSNHNYVRANNQAVLLQRLIEKETILSPVTVETLVK